MTPPTRTDRIYHAALAGSLALLGGLLVWRPLAGWLDFWAHAAVGRWIWQTGTVPDRTLYLWTADEPWVYHSWLFQLLAYGLTQVGGADRLPHIVLGLTIFLVLLPFGLAWGVWRRGGRLSAWMAVPFALALRGPALRFQTRPELFSVVGLCLLFVFLIAWSGRPRAERPPSVTRREWVRAALVLGMFAIWANLHGAVVTGLLVFGVTAVCDLVQDRADRRARVLTGLAVLAPVTACVNPYGLSYWRSLQPVGGRTFGSVREWLPVWEAPALPTEMAVAASALAVLAVAAWALNPNRRWAHLAWLVLVGGLFVGARRNVWPFSLTCLMVIAANARSLDPEVWWKRVRRWLGSGGPSGVPSLLRWPVRGVVLAGVLLECVAVAMTIQPEQPLVPSPLDEGIVRFLREHPGDWRPFNDYENSGYLQWRLAGSPPLYIDLLNAYPDRVMQDYGEIASQTGRGRHLLDEQGIDLVVLTTNRGGTPSLARLADRLDDDAGWARAYVGGDGVIWVRRTDANRPLWDAPVSGVRFALLERWGNASEVVVPPTRPPSFGLPKGAKAPGRPGAK